MFGDNQVHLWYTDPNDVPASLLPRYRELISSDEKDRGDRFYFEEDRRLFLVSHCLVRVMLSRYIGVPPQELQFKTIGQGKPVLTGFGDTLPVQFNLSHTRGMAVVGITMKNDLGVDVEQVKRSTSLDVADRNFAPEENRFLQLVPPEDRRRLFFRIWTLKEAYLKARALGIGFPLQMFAFQLDADEPRITFADSLEDDPMQWQFFETQPAPDFPVAVAVRRPADQAISLISQSVVPLADEDATP